MILSMPLPVGLDVVVRERVGRTIADARSEKGWTQRDLATHAGFDAMTVSRVERGVGGELETIIRLARTLGVPLGELFTEYAEHEAQQVELREVKALVVDVMGQIAELTERLDRLTPPDGQEGS